MGLEKETIHSLSEKLNKGETSSVELVRDVLKRIGDVEPTIRSYTTVSEKTALQEAGEADRRFKAGTPRGPLDGIPIALKDNMCTRGIPTTCSSKMLESYVPPYDATVTRKLKDAGAVIIGKTNMDEFAMGSSTENSAFGPTGNPWDPKRVTGGSSGGSAAAVAADACIGALGSDTGGSIRQPAAFCGVVGLKPTYGRVSRYGLVAFASSLDQIGPVSKNVRDSALLLKTIAGHDPMDSTSVKTDVPDYTARLADFPEGLRVGVPKEFFIEGLDPEVEEAVRKAVSTLEGQGAKTVEISLPHTEYAVATYYILATAEASSNLARYDGVRYGYRDSGAGELLEMYNRTRQAGFGPEVKRRIMIGTYALSSGYYDAYYRKAQCVRTLIKADFDEAFKDVDVIITPSTPTPAFKMGEKTTDPLQM
ncbi:MAG TPA: Asp-tRNA(Asn)/Glu-tRNA(Gln) amidotransferase subunit GatA, partial [Nitrospiria bacterium]